MMDIFLERERYFNDTLKDCEIGAVVMLEKYQNFGPFLVVGHDNRYIRLFDFEDGTFTFFNKDEHVEVLDVELHLR